MKKKDKKAPVKKAAPKKKTANPKPGTIAAFEKALEIARKAGNKIEFTNQ